ncbi:MAG TPA: sigma-70 family RNA polymerase sigma factor [Blastocatellia bacterium]|nr:sigma-70 family RNA polymerase sigma factor [Blastocatellia bacterium]
MRDKKLESVQLKFEDEALSHLSTLLKAAVRIVGRPQEAEDVVQETYLRAWKYFDSFETGTNCRAWLFRIMFNVVNGRRGKQAKAAEVPLDDTLDQHHSNVIQFDPTRQIEGHELLEAAGLLTEVHRSVLWLVVVEEFSYREAAEVLDVPIGTVMSRLHRARDELRKLLIRRNSSSARG